MKLNKLFFWLFSFCLVIIKLGYSDNYLKKANNLYFNKAYAKAIVFYEKAEEKKELKLDDYIKLADCYRLTNNSIKEEKCYSNITQTSTNPVYKYYYAQALIKNGKANEAKKWLQEFNKEDITDKRGLNSINDLNNIEKLYKDTTKWVIKKLNINSQEADFCAIPYKSGIVFTSSRKRPDLISYTNDWTNELFLNLYYSEKINDNTFEIPVPFKKIETKYNDGPISYLNYGEQKEMYLTRNNLVNGIEKIANDKSIKLQLFFFQINDREEFGPIKSFQHNDKDYNYAHPSISFDGKKLFFASDMPGGFGGMDLYVCQRDGDGWTTPKNLGAEINTKGNEVFPYYHNNDQLFFSSDGLGGIGGLDIYVTYEQKRDFIRPKNIGSPVNSVNDDFGFVLEQSNTKGYFSSNRANKNTDDDLYTFATDVLNKIQFTIDVVDIISLQNIPGSSIVIKNKETKELIELNPNNKTFIGELTPNLEYEITASANGYNSNTVTLIADKTNSYAVLKLKRSMVLELGLTIFNNPLERKPLKDISVVLEDINEKVFEATTNEKGKVPTTELNPETDYKITITNNNNKTNSVRFNTFNQTTSKLYEQAIYLENKNASCLSLVIFDKQKLGEQISNAKITIVDAITREKITEGSTTKDGKFIDCNLSAGKAYNVTIAKSGYFSKNDFVTIPPKKDLEKVFDLEKIVLDKAIKIDNIYFDVGKWDIRKDAAKELDKVVKLLKENPEIIIELGSHTDCRNSENVNLDLSQRRASASAEYIAAKGIERDRINARGYGESEPVNKCLCEGSINVPCSEKEHQANRRTEFKVVGFINNN